MAALNKYRVRKGWFGKSILQRLYDSPTLQGGHVDVFTRELIWFDVSYKNAPVTLFEQPASKLGVE